LSFWGLFASAFKKLKKNKKIDCTLVIFFAVNHPFGMFKLEFSGGPTTNLGCALPRIISELVEASVHVHHALKG